MSDATDYYAQPGVMTDLGGRAGGLDGVPPDPRGVAGVVQGLVLPIAWADRYGVDVTAPREAELQIRSAGRMVDRLLAIDPRPLPEPRQPARRLVGNCRHVATLAVALLRRARTPARARCGFARYVEAGRWVERWVVEHHDGDRWRVLDAQVDALQREAMGLADDPADLPAGQFLPAGEAWLRGRSGDDDSDRFGIRDMWGRWFIEGNIARDLAALNKVEMLPWDDWGALAGTGPVPGGDAFVDEVAALTVSGDHEAIRRRYETDERLRVPPRVFNMAGGRVVAVDVPELSP